MATFIPNYGLHQWVPEDKFLRTDFNEDFSKLDIELGRVDGVATEFYRAVPNLAYTVYDLALKDYYESKYHGYRRALLMDSFLSQANISSLTGGLVVQNGALVLNGAGKMGTMTTYRLSLGDVEWARVVAWVKYALGGLYTMAVNGVALEKQEAWSTQTVDGIECRELQFGGDVAGSGSAEISITLDTSSGSSATVYEYGVMFL